MAAIEIPPIQRAAIVALADLSCSPWKFDLLWDVWQSLDVSHATFGDLAQRILRPELEELFLCSAAAFDDLTIFGDLVGDPDAPRSYSREAYRAAYLAIRPMLFRIDVDGLPRPPNSTAQDEYLERLVLFCRLDASRRTARGFSPVFWSRLR
ncbi:MAG: hypothetical protein R3D30_12360 [Hyphomicrobiales bacterium]